MKYLLIVLLFTSCASVNPCDTINVSTSEGRLDKSSCILDQVSQDKDTERYPKRK